MKTTITINGTVFELPAGDDTARLVAADALQEAGFDEAAQMMRADSGLIPASGFRLGSRFFREVNTRRGNQARSR